MSTTTSESPNPTGATAPLGGAAISPPPGYAAPPPHITTEEEEDEVDTPAHTAPLLPPHPRPSAAAVLAHAAAAASAFLLHLSDDLKAWDAGSGEPPVPAPRHKRGRASVARGGGEPAKRSPSLFNTFVKVKMAELKGRGWKPQPGDTHIAKVSRMWKRLDERGRAEFAERVGMVALHGGGGGPSLAAPQSGPPLVPAAATPNLFEPIAAAEAGAAPAAASKKKKKKKAKTEGGGKW